MSATTTATPGSRAGWLGEDRLVQPADAAAELGIRLRHLRTLTRAGLVPAVHIGPRFVRYRLADLRTFVEANRF